VRVEAALRTTSKKHALRRWVDGKKCPRDDYFASIDGVRQLLQRHAGDEDAPDPDYQAIAPVIARLLDQEGALYDYVGSQEHCPDNDEGWATVCLAAAWVLLERYEEAEKGDKWPPTK
jgi:hypothetical protein